MDDDNSFDLLCTFLLKLRNDYKDKLKNGTSFGYFKKNNKTEHTSLSTSFHQDLTIHNLLDFLLSSFKSIDTNSISKGQYIVLNDLINKKLLVKQVALNDLQINDLKEVKNQCLEKFRDVFRDDSIDLNENENVNLPDELNEDDSLDLDKFTASQLMNLYQKMSQLFNVGGGTKNFPNTSNNDINLVDNLKNSCFKLLDKIIRSENHLKILKTHLDNKTVPRSLEVNRFPRPVLMHDVTFVEEYNNLISKFQEDSLNLAIKRLQDSKLSKTEEFVMKKDLLAINMNNVDFLMSSFKEKIEKKNKKKFDKMDAELKRTYVKKLFIHSTTNSNDESSNDDSDSSFISRAKQDKNKNKKNNKNHYDKNNSVQIHDFNSSNNNNNNNRNQFNNNKRNFTTTNINNQQSKISNDYRGSLNTSRESISFKNNNNNNRVRFNNNVNFNNNKERNNYYNNNNRERTNYNNYNNRERVNFNNNNKYRMREFNDNRRNELNNDYNENFGQERNRNINSNNNSARNNSDFQWHQNLRSRYRHQNLRSRYRHQSE